MSSDYFIDFNGHKRVHGTVSAYKNGGCRCDDCRNRANTYNAAYKRRVRAARSAEGQRDPGAPVGMRLGKVEFPRVVAEQAACKEHPTEWWFPGKHASGFDGVPTPTVAKALAICRACPVRVECLDYAVDAVELGIWGGTFGKERRALRVQRNAQRRATPAAETPVVVSAPSERVIGIPHSKNSYLGDRIA